MTHKEFIQILSMTTESLNMVEFYSCEIDMAIPFEDKAFFKNSIARKLEFYNLVLLNCNSQIPLCAKVDILLEPLIQNKEVTNIQMTVEVVDPKDRDNKINFKFEK